MLENIKNEIYQRLDILFAETTVYDLTNDMTNYKKNLEKIAYIADSLDIKTDIVTVKINLRGN